MFDRSMCPPERHQPAAGAPAAEDDELAGVTEDGLAQFALGEVERQAAERGEQVTEVDMSFVQRALAESNRMRRETENSDAKRAAMWESIAAAQGPDGVAHLQSAMCEHKVETAAYLTTQQQQLEQQLLEESEAAEAQA